MTLTIVSYPLTQANLDRMEELDAKIIKAVGVKSGGGGAGYGRRDVEFWGLRRSVARIEQAVAGLGIDDIQVHRL
jgi:hypothetical protein